MSPSHRVRPAPRLRTPATSTAAAIAASIAVAAPVSLQAQAPAGVPAGQTSWWAAEGDGDDSAGDNHGSLEGGVSFDAGVLGQSFVFDGLGSHVRAASSPDLNPPGSFSIAAWVCPSTPDAVIASKWGDSGPWPIDRSWVLQLFQGRLQFGISDAARQFDSAFHAMVSTGTVTLGVWSHVAGVYHQSTGRRVSYINGVMVAERTDPPITITQGNADVSIGAWMRAPGSVAAPYTGRVDEVIVYDRALTAQEVMDPGFNAGAGASCACSPSSCSDQGLSCGQADDGCGNALDCGACAAASCSGSIFTAAGRCDGGACATPAPVDCDDGNVCTADRCDPSTGCSSSGSTVCCAGLSALLDGLRPGCPPVASLIAHASAFDCSTDPPSCPRGRFNAFCRELKGSGNAKSGISAADQSALRGYAERLCGGPCP